jgi:hypothetical protein
MSDSADAAMSSTSGTPQHARARVLGAVSMIVGAFPAVFIAAHALVPMPMPSSFPWLWLGLSLLGVAAAVAALRARPRGRLAAALALTGLVLSLSFPAMVAFVFVRYLNWSS